MEDYLYQELYDLENEHWWFVSKKRIVLSMVEKYFVSAHGNRILDVGCGSGLMLKDLEKYGQVHGMDYSSEALKFSARNFSGTLKQGFLPGGMPFPEDYFDLIVALDILEHIEDDSSSLIDIKAHLRDGGICLVTVPAYMFLWSNHDVVHAHKRRYTKDMLRKTIEVANMKVLKLSYYNSLLFPPIMITRVLHRLMKKDNGSDAQMPGRFLNTVFKGIFSSESYFLNHLNFGFGVSLIAVLQK